MGDETNTPGSPPKKSKSPTWIGKVVTAKDEQIAAIRELADDKVAFMIDRLEVEYQEREKRSQTLYEISQDRADDMQKSLDGKDITIRRLWIANLLQVLIIAALAGVTITGKLPGVGDIGLSPQTQTK